MNCRIAKRMTLEFDASRAADTIPAALRTHLEECSDCARLQRQSSLAASWLRDLPEAEPPANFDWRLKLRLSQLERDPAAAEPLPAPRRSWALPFVMSSAAAATLVVVFGWMAANRFETRETPQAEAGTSAPALARWSPAPAERGSVSDRKSVV